MRVIPQKGLIINYKPGDILFRYKPVWYGNNEDVSYMKDSNMGGPIKLLEVNNKRITFHPTHYGEFSEMIYKFEENELKIGLWLDGWKKIN